jgi:serine/threonine protein kinase
MCEYCVGNEPIANYRLVRFLGRGGFGEVWQAKAPGGIEVAMKFIRLDKKAGKKEFESLRVVKRIKHPHLMAINAFWLKDADGKVLDDDDVDLLGMNLRRARSGSQSTSETLFLAESHAAELVIALELCDQNLLDRLHECQATGLQGIPPDELLDYMDGCAKAIDYLNSPVHVLEDGDKKAVQHCDIKPQNIMLLGGEPKVCDFGLVRAQSDVRKTAIAASLAYAPPEILIQGQQSAATDQYSLAVTYYELRTGELPFSEEAANHFAIIKAHEQGTLDFSRLPDGERAVIERATMLNPAARFARTADMVAALRRAYRGESDIIPAGDLNSPASPWKETRPNNKAPTAPILAGKPAHSGVRRLAFVTLLLGGMGIGGVLVGRMYVEQCVDRALVDHEMETALAVLTRFERLPWLIDPDLPARVARRADERTADDWRRSQKVYDGLVSRWPSEPALKDLKENLIRAGVKELHDLIEKDPGAAEALRRSLAESFGTARH